MADTITSTDVGLKENEEDDRGHGLFGFNVLSRANRWAQPITYMDVHECDGFTVCYIISFTLILIYVIVENFKIQLKLVNDFMKEQMYYLPNLHHIYDK